jgi:hypothetical protein
MNEWVDTGDICPTCDYVGDHLVTDAGVFCGRCKNKIGEPEDIDEVEI